MPYEWLLQFILFSMNFHQIKKVGFQPSDFKQDFKSLICHVQILWLNWNISAKNKNYSTIQADLISELWETHTFQLNNTFWWMKLVTCFLTPSNRMNVWRISVHPEIITIWVSIKMEPYSVATNLNARTYNIQHCVLKCLSTTQQLLFKYYV